MKSAIRRAAAILWRVRRGFDKALIHFSLPFLLRPKSYHQLVRLGTNYGGWFVPSDVLTKDSICYCFGVGIDASFDFALVRKFKCSVFSFDPTPLSIAYMSKEVYDRSKLHFEPIGVWNEDTELRFYAPANPEHTSHSVYDLHGTGKYFVANCRKLSTIMHQFGHIKIDLLKLDIEGAWRKVVDDIIKEKIDVSVLCIELDSPVTLSSVFQTIRSLKRAGFSLVQVEKDNYTFLSQKLCQ